MIHYVIRGKGVYRARGRTYPICEGGAFLIVPGLQFTGAVRINGEKALTWSPLQVLSLNYNWVDILRKRRFFQW